MPVPMATPAQIAAPKPSRNAKDHLPSRTVPAIAGEIVNRPGTNFASTKVRLPQRWNRYSDWRTQDSGDNDIRHRSFITRRPNSRPTVYQVASLMAQAMNATANSANAEIFPSAANAPATISVGSAGIGRPICWMRTFANTSARPYCVIKPTIDCQSSLQAFEGYRSLDRLRQGWLDPMSSSFRFARPALTLKCRIGMSARMRLDHGSL